MEGVGWVVRSSCFVCLVFSYVFHFHVYVYVHPITTYPLNTHVEVSGVLTWKRFFPQYIQPASPAPRLT